MDMNLIAHIYTCSVAGLYESRDWHDDDNASAMKHGFIATDDGGHQLHDAYFDSYEPFQQGSWPTPFIEEDDMDLSELPPSPLAAERAASLECSQHLRFLNQYRRMLGKTGKRPFRKLAVPRQARTVAIVVYSTCCGLRYLFFTVATRTYSIRSRTSLPRSLLTYLSSPLTAS